MSIDREAAALGIELAEASQESWASPSTRAMTEAAVAWLALPTEPDRPGGLSESDRAELRGWAERAAVRPKAAKSRWVAQKVLRLLRENYALKHKDGR